MKRIAQPQTKAAPATKKRNQAAFIVKRWPVAFRHEGSMLGLTCCHYAQIVNADQEPPLFAGEVSV